MKNEIDKDFYCSAGCFLLDGKISVCLKCFMDDEKDGDDLCHKICKNYHRKHPTPKQYKKEYGEEYPDDGAVYCKQIRPKEGTESPWHIFSYIWFKENRQRYLKDKEKLLCVCACTPFGKPHDNWRPK